MILGEMLQDVSILQYSCPRVRPSCVVVVVISGVPKYQESGHFLAWVQALNPLGGMIWLPGNCIDHVLMIIVSA